MGLSKIGNFDFFEFIVFLQFTVLVNDWRCYPGTVHEVLEVLFVLSVMSKSQLFWFIIFWFLNLKVKFLPNFNLKANYEKKKKIPGLEKVCKVGRTGRCVYT